MNKMTPWGESQFSHVIADGIVEHATAGHGGIHLSEARLNIVKQKHPNFKTFCGKPNWFEEDCDVCIVVNCFPEFFSKDAVEYANKRIKEDSYFTGTPA